MHITLFLHALQRYVKILVIVSVVYFVADSQGILNSLQLQWSGNRKLMRQIEVGI